MSHFAGNPHIAASGAAPDPSTAPANAAGPDRPATILSSRGPLDLLERPFHHVLARGALPEPYYRELSASFPTAEVVLNGRAATLGNAAARLPASKVAGHRAIAPVWRDFMARHTSARFWSDILRVFGAALRQALPDLEARAGKPMEHWHAGPRGLEAHAGAPFDVRLDCQFVINTPWPTHSAHPRPPSVKTQHVDKRDTIFSALLYVRDQDDRSVGGELQLYEWNRPPRFLRQRMILPRDLTLRSAIPYSANTLVGFVNSPLAAHGVSPREASEFPRRYINFIAETRVKAFETPTAGRLTQLMHWPIRKALGLRAIGGDRY